MAPFFCKRSLALIALLPFSAGALLSQPLGVRAQTCDPSIMSCLDGGVNDTPIQGPVSSQPTPTVVEPRLKPAVYSAHDACVDQADAAYLRCAGTLNGRGMLGAAAAGALTGVHGGPIGAGAGAVGGASGFALGKAVECLGGYVADRAACPAP